MVGAGVGVGLVRAADRDDRPLQQDPLVVGGVAHAGFAAVSR